MSARDISEHFYKASISKDGILTVNTDEIPKSHINGRLNSNHTTFERKDCYGIRFSIYRELTMRINKIMYKVEIQSDAGTNTFIGYYDMETVMTLVNWYNNYEELRLERDFMKNGCPAEMAFFKV